MTLRNILDLTLLASHVIYLGDACIDLDAGSTPQTLSSHDDYGNSNYENNMDVCWQLIAPENRKVHVFSDQRLQLEEDSCNDSLTITCGSRWDDLIGTYCDNDVIGEVYSSTRKMYLHFLSDGNTTGRGFQISYEYVSDRHSATCREYTKQEQTDISIVGLTFGSVMLLALLVLLIICWKGNQNKRRMQINPLMDPDHAALARARALHLRRHSVPSRRNAFNTETTANADDAPTYDTPRRAPRDTRRSRGGTNGNGINNGNPGMNQGNPRLNLGNPELQPPPAYDSSTSPTQRHTLTRQSRADIQPPLDYNPPPDYQAVDTTTNRLELERDSTHGTVNNSRNIISVVAQSRYVSQQPELNPGPTNRNSGNETIGNDITINANNDVTIYSPNDVTNPPNYVTEPPPEAESFAYEFHPSTPPPAYVEFEQNNGQADGEANNEECN